MNGSKAPLQLYVVDLRYTAVEVERRQKPLPWDAAQRFKARQAIEVEKARLLTEDVNIASLFDHDDEITVMRRNYTVDFFQLFNMGYQNYSEGEWQVARRLLTHSHTMLGFN